MPSPLQNAMRPPPARATTPRAMRLQNSLPSPYRPNTGFPSAYQEPEQTPWADWGTSVLGFLAPSPEDQAMMIRNQQESDRLMNEGRMKEAMMNKFDPEVMRVMGPELLGAGSTH